MLARDVEENKQLGEHGAKHIIKNCFCPKDGVSILTHCNTGSLATAGYGTALGKPQTTELSLYLIYAYDQCSL